MWKRSVCKISKFSFFRQRFWSKRQDTQFSHDNNTPPSGNPFSPPRCPLKRQQRPWVRPIRSVRTPARNVHTNQPHPPIKRSQPQHGLTWRRIYESSAHDVTRIHDVTWRKQQFNDVSNCSEPHRQTVLDAELLLRSSTVTSQHNIISTPKELRQTHS